MAWPAAVDSTAATSSSVVEGSEGKGPEGEGSEGEGSEGEGSEAGALTRVLPISARGGDAERVRPPSSTPSSSTPPSSIPPAGTSSTPPEDSGASEDNAANTLPDTAPLAPLALEDSEFVESAAGGRTEAASMEAASMEAAAMEAAAVKAAFTAGPSASAAHCI